MWQIVCCELMAWCCRPVTVTGKCDQLGVFCVLLIETGKQQDSTTVRSDRGGSWLQVKSQLSCYQSAEESHLSGSLSLPIRDRPLKFLPSQWRKCRAGGVCRADAGPDKSQTGYEISQQRSEGSPPESQPTIYIHIIYNIYLYTYLYIFIGTFPPGVWSSLNDRLRPRSDTS